MGISPILAILIGFVSPLLISPLKKRAWPKWKKIILVIIVASACSIVSVWLTGDLDAKTFRESVSLVISVSWASYNLLWEKTKINQDITEKVIEKVAP